jgi:GxxExxY protein
MSLSYPESHELSHRVIGAAINVHKELGPGLLESIYQECLEIELADAGLRFLRQEAIPIVYKGRDIKATYRPDLVIEGTIVVEAKSIEKIAPVHRSQVLTYLKLTILHVGLLINFNTEVLINGVVRVSL